jgi:hypothetical protein
VINTVLDVQRRAQQTGRLRIGQTLISKNGKPYPTALDTFRFTTGSRFVAESVASLYGGQVRPWEGHRSQFEVITAERELFVTIPPRDGVFSMAYEMWKGGGLVRRCNSQRQEGGSVCECPHAEDTTNADEVHTAGLERSRLAKLNPPRACALVTRISVVIPDLAGLGIWRLDTKSYNAAVDIGDQAEMLEKAREHGIYLRAQLRIDRIERPVDGQTRKFTVPVLTILDTFRDVVSGAIEGRSIAAQLPPAPGQPLALAAGPASAPARELPAAPEPNVPLTAQQIADRVGQVARLDELAPFVSVAKEQRCGDDLVRTSLPGEQPEAWETLGEFINARWSELGGQARAS